MTTTDADAVPVETVPPLGHDEAQDLFAAEVARTVELLRTLSAEQWAAPTDCPAWDVRSMQLHVLGACESGASMRELAHQMLAARRRQKGEGGPLEASLSAVQVADRSELSTAELVDRLASVALRAVRRRRRTPALARRLSMKVDGPVVERWTLGYLNDTIYLRDAWMHRIDVCRAAGIPPTLTPEHDGRIVADVVAELGRRHGGPFDLVLTGPAGGRYRSGRDAPEPPVTIDAVELCRTLAGRERGEGLLATVVPF